MSCGLPLDDDGADATSHCCACGGGHLPPSAPPSPPPPAPPPATTAIFGFEEVTSPGWTSGSATTHAMTRTAGATPSRSYGTGPAGGYDGNGSYYFAEATDRSPGDVFSLAYDGSVCASAGLPVATVAFEHHLFGADIGVLRVIDAEGRERWSMGGDRGDAWRYALVDVHSASFAFRYELGSSFRGDAALDQVVVECGVAPPSPPHHPPAPPPWPPDAAPTPPPVLPPSWPPPPLPPLPTGAFASISVLSSAVAEWLADRDAAEDKYGPIGGWDVSHITDMASLFDGLSTFNGDVDDWDVGRVDDWDVGRVTNMHKAFYGANQFNQALDSWDTSSVTNMAELFRGCGAFNSALDSWDTSSVTSLSNTFFVRARTAPSPLLLPARQLTPRTAPCAGGRQLQPAARLVGHVFGHVVAKHL